MHSSVSQCTQCIPLPCSASHHIAVHPVSSTSPIAFHCPQSLPVPPSAPKLSPQSLLPFLSPSGLAQGPGSIPAGLCPHSLASPRSLHALWDVCPVLALLRDGAIPPPGVTTPIPAGDSGLDPLGPVSPGLSGFSSAAASAAPRAPAPCPRHPGERRGHPALPWGHQGWPPAGCWGTVGGGDPTAVLSHRLGWGPVAASARGGDRQGACPRSLRDAHRGRAPGPPVGGAAQVRWLLPRAALLHHRLQGQAQEPRPGGAGRGGRPALGAGAHQADGAAAGHEPAGEARPVSFVGQRGVAWGQLGDSPGTALGQPGDSLGRFP